MTSPTGAAGSAAPAADGAASTPPNFTPSASSPSAFIPSGGTLTPRAVIVHRRTEREQIVRERGTWGQAKFQAGRAPATVAALASVSVRHDATEQALQTVSAAIPGGWRRGSVEREDLDRFLFEPEDLVIVVGQDGLVANVAKYLGGQPVIGIDPNPGSGMGVLTRHRAEDCARLLAAASQGKAQAQQRTMVEAVVDGSASGLGLTALNEIYVGSPTHQSARYVLTLPDGRAETQSSSGLLAGTGTGATGWLLSAARERRSTMPLPAPTDRSLGWFVREAWPSPGTGADLTEGLVDEQQSLTILVRSETLVLFGDGMEADRVPLTWGQTVSLAPARRTLTLIV
jgi:NAD kinase